MKLKHVLIIAAVLLALLVVPAAADENQDIKTDTAEIGLTASVEFSIDIPAEDFAFQKVTEGSTVEGTIGVGITRIDPNAVVSLSVSAGDDGWYLKHTSKSGDSIAYNMTVDNTEIKNGDILLSAAKTTTKKAIFTLKEDAKKSGQYTDTLTFTAEMKKLTDIFASAEEGTPTTISLGAGTYVFPSDSLSEDVTLVCDEGTVFEGKSGLNINGATVVGATFDNPGNTAVGGTINGVLKDCTFTGSNGLRYCYAGETVVFENCVFDGSTYGVHFDGGANEVLFKGCTISGFNALGAALTQVTFEDCTFVSTGKSSYNGANLWGNATLKNCEFTFDGSSSYEWIDCIGTDKVYVFENCTVNGVAYTSENYQDFLDNIFSRNDVAVTIDGVSCTLKEETESGE